MVDMVQTPFCVKKNPFNCLCFKNIFKFPTQLSCFKSLLLAKKYLTSARFQVFTWFTTAWEQAVFGGFQKEDAVEHRFFEVRTTEF